MTFRRLLLLSCVLGALVPASASAASLPTVARTISAASTTKATCMSAPATGAGLASTSYTAPMSGYLTVRLTGAGDWDLLMRNADGVGEHASQGFGGSEVIQTWIAAGEKITLEGCRYAGASRTAKVSFQLLDVKPPTETTQALVRVKADPPTQRQLSNAGFDLDESHGADWADIVVDAQQLAKLRELGFKPAVRQADLAAYDNQTLRSDRRKARAAAADSPLPSGRDTYRLYEDIQADLKKLAADHPDIVKPIIIGKSYQGRELSGLEIADDVNAKDGRPTFFLMGVHHAREWPSAEIAMEWATLLATSKDPDVAKILKKERSTVVPLINPDGYIDSRTAPSAADTIYNSPTGSPIGDGTIETGEAVGGFGGSGAYRRKNCDNEDGNPSTPCDSAHGVDNNRNYGNLWGGNGASADISSQSYHGQAPRSEPETQAVFNYVTHHHVTTLITLHTIAALVLRPPGLSGSGLAPDEKAMKKLGDKMAGATGYTSEFGWQLYDTAGTTEDDTYAATGGYGYTIELGPSGGLFHGPYDINVIKQWTGDESGKANGGMHRALLLAAATAISPKSHAQLVGTAPPGNTLHITKKFDTLTSKYCLRGVDPAVSNPATDNTKCADAMKDPITLKDSMDTSMEVPKSGRFTWDIGQSTRPFVNGGATVQETKDKQPPIFTADGTPGAPTSDKDFEFKLPDQLGKDKVRVDVDISAGEDYDLTVYKKEANGDETAVGSSGNTPGADESVMIDEPVPGATYIARVNYFAGGSGAYKVIVTQVSVASKLTTGHKEAYTLSCEDPGGKVLESYQLVIDRGQKVTLNLGCGKGKSTDAAGHVLSTATGCKLPNTAPTIGCRKIALGAGKLKVKLGKRKVTKKAITVRCTLSGAGTCTVTAKVGKTKLGKGKARFKKAGTRVVKIKLSKKARKALARGGRLKLTAKGKAR
ncbi:MAG: hypothetical protein QOF76_1455 [Solirubrobacteraceae bacterium]|nr:hypothetical protein [Solirubrobacteraceae bacterium]